MNYEKELSEMIKAAKLAEEWILKIYHSRFDVEIKNDNSPVTEADKGADEIIRKHLSSKFPDYGFLTEESRDTSERLGKECVFIVDPVDGTKEFVSRNGQFTTNIALAKKGEVVAGVINIPLLDTIYFASKNSGSFKQEGKNEPIRIHCSTRRKKGLRAVRSISFFNEQEKALYAKHADAYESIKPLGASQKFCAIAEGKAEVSLRMSFGTKEWDIASGDIIVKEAGGFLLEPPALTPFRYNREDIYNRHGYVLVNSKENILL